VTTTATVSDSVISGVGVNFGVVAVSGGTGAVSQAFVTRCTIEATGRPIDAETVGGLGSAVLAVSATTIVNNLMPWWQNGTGSVIRSLGNNHITDNASSGTGVLTSTALQ
jgi:hypothetical protein